MRRAKKGLRPTGLAVAVCAALVSGCMHLNVPRIDPTGERIFAEPVITPAPPPGRPSPSPCFADRVDLVLFPVETVASIGSEVILLAGVRASDDYLRTNERVEWMIEPGGPGHFVDLDRGSSLSFLVGDFTRPHKVDNTFAIGSTSRTRQHLTRGTPTPADDVFVEPGQTWIAVSAAHEGVSRVTAYAPGVVDANRRRQTATIHWIDAQWCLPPPAIQPAGTRHTLTTTVTRQTDHSPCPGWLVRYEVLDGPGAGFAPDGAPAIEVPTDPQGQASVEIFQTAPAPGTNRIGIQIIRPAVLGGLAAKPIVVGGGTVLVTWSAPDIAVTKTGPAVAGAGATLTYRIVASNPGDLPADDVVVTDVVPDGLTYVRSDPEGEGAGRSIRWRLGTLGPGETRSIEVDFRADAQGDVTNCAEVTAAGGLRAEHCATTAIATPQVEVQVAGPERSVRVGDEATFRIVVTNRGSTVLSGLLIKDRFDAGLEHAEFSSPIERDLGTDLAPGQSQQIGVVLRVVRPGRWCNTVEILAQGRVLATAQACLQAVEASVPPREPEVTRPEVPKPAVPAPRAALAVRMVAPEAREVGQTVDFQIEVANDGEAALTGVSVVASFDRQLDPRLAADGHRREGANLIWNYDTLPPGQIRRLTIRCECLLPGARACGYVVATADGGVEQRAEACLRIDQAPPPGAPQLDLTVTDTHDPIDLGRQMTYVVRVANVGEIADRQVAVAVAIPPEMELVKFTTFGPPSIDYRVVGQTVRFDPVESLEPGASLEYRVRVRAREPGEARVRAELTSQSLIVPKFDEETTLVNPAHPAPVR